MSNKKITTPAGLRRLETRLVEAQTRLSELIASKAEAAENGGNQWHDNASFEELERTERIMRKQIGDLSQQITQVVVSEECAVGDHVGLGTTVTLRFANGELRSFEIRGYGESDPAAGIVAYDAPLGRAVMGARVGETVSFSVGARSRSVTIEAVR